MSKGLKRVFRAGADTQGVRLDYFVAAQLAPEFSRSQIARMVKLGRITLNGSPARVSARLRRGDEIEIAEPNQNSSARTQQSDRSNEAPPVEVLHADTELIAINKPAGLPVHPAPSYRGATLVDSMLRQFPDLGEMIEPDAMPRPGIVHRLDKDTSGVMVIARTPLARTSLSRQFKDRTVRKTYVALVKGSLARGEITIERPLGRHPTERKRMSVRSRKPRDALSHVQVIERFRILGQALTFVWVRPATGRTHQIRVHLASIGHPCIADALYGGGAGSQAYGFERQALHAIALIVTHPRTGARMRFVAPLPEDFVRFLDSQNSQVDFDALAATRADEV